MLCTKKNDTYHAIYHLNWYKLWGKNRSNLYIPWYITPWLRYIPWYIPKNWYIPWYIPWGNNRSRFPTSSIYHGIYHGTYHGIYLFFWYIPWYKASIAFLPGLNGTKLLPFPGGHATQARKFVFSTIPEDSGDGDTQQDRADWSDRDWDDYNYAPPGGGAGCRQGAVMRDPLTELCDDLFGFEAEDITALLCDLPIPRPGDVPGMTVEEAIKVWLCVYKGIYHCIYHGILHGIYYCIYHGIYSAIYHVTYHDIYTYIYFYDMYINNHESNLGEYLTSDWVSILLFTLSFVLQDLIEPEVC